jgi:hypothetical protein
MVGSDRAIILDRNLRNYAAGFERDRGNKGGSAPDFIYQSGSRRPQSVRPCSSGRGELRNQKDFIGDFCAGK